MSQFEPTDVQVGLRQPGSTQLFRQILVKTPEAPFMIELPGAVRRVGGALAHSILPYGRVLLPGKHSVTAAQVTGAILDERELDHAVSLMAEHLGTRMPEAFSIRLHTPDTSYGELIERAADAGGGCGCDDSSASGAILRGAISVGAAAQACDELVWTKYINAQIRVTIEDQTYIGEEEIALNIGSLFFDCYSDWEGIWTRRTRCYGPCPAPQICNCGRNSRNVPQVFCRGWTFCFCS